MDFWPFPFTNTMVKGIYKFWKVQGLIDRFNESLRKIVYGVIKNSNESMSDMQFITMPKGDLPHYYKNFRNPEPFGAEIKNVTFSRLGTMLHLYTKKVKEGMKTSKYQKEILGPVFHEETKYG